MDYPDSTKAHPNGAPSPYKPKEGPIKQNLDKLKEESVPQAPEDHDDIAITPEPGKGSLFEGFEFKDLQLLDESIDITNFGNMECSIRQTNRCRLTAENIWEVKRETGTVSIDLKIPQGAIPASSLLIRVALVKRQGEKNFGATIICPKHQQLKKVMSPSHILHPGRGLKHYFDSKNMNNSLCFQLSQFNNIQESGTARISIKSLCTSNCPTNNDPNYVHSEAEKGNILLISLETPFMGTVLSRKSFPVEVKDKMSAQSPKKDAAESKSPGASMKPRKRRIMPRTAYVAAKQKERGRFKAMKKMMMGASEFMKIMGYPNPQLIKDLEQEAQKPFQYGS